MRRRIIDDSKLKELLRQGKTLMEMGKELGVSHVAVHKRLKKIGLLELPKSLESLTPKEQKFVLTVAEGKSRTQACMESFDVSSRESAKALQNSLMKNPAIKIAVDDLMEIRGIGREFRVERLGQHMKSNDPVVSLKALDMGFKIAGDENESKREVRDIGIVEYDSIPFEFQYGNRVSERFKKVAGRCALCEKESNDDICNLCIEKYPDIVDKLTRYWAGDECAICKDDKRSYGFCKSCKEKKEAINHV